MRSHHQRTRWMVLALAFLAISRLVVARASAHPGASVGGTSSASHKMFLPLVLNPPSNSPPSVPTDPVPSDGAADQSVDGLLRWTGGDPDGDGVVYDVILALDSDTLESRVCSGTTTPSCDPGSLNNNTRYRWRVVSTDARGAVTEGPVWAFTTEAETPDTNFATEVVRLTNQERAKEGCPALNTSAQLTAAAERHSEDMAYNDVFDHMGSDGSSPWDRIEATGYTYGMAAENIAAGYLTPADVVAGWMASDGHRANILNCGLTEIGVGYVYLADDPGELRFRHYWTQVFATPR